MKFLPSAAANADSILGQYGAARRSSVDALGIHLAQTSAGAEMSTVLRLQEDSRVQFAEPNYVARGAGHAIPTDPFYESAQANLRVIGMPDAWHLTVGSQAVITAVIDTGIDFGHVDLDSRIGNLTGAGPPGADHVFLSAPSAECPAAAAPEDDGWRGSVSPFNHGSHVAGIIAAKTSIAGDPAVGMAGIAPATRLAPLKVLDCSGTGTFFDIANAIVFAAAGGARIANLSLGTPGDQPSCPRSIQEPIDFAAARGMLLVVASGSDGSTNRSLPAVCDRVVGVGATDNNDVVATFSQRNSTVDLSAPGASIVGPGRSADGARGWFLASGTSMAAPHVAGCAALIWSIAPTLVADQVETILRRTVLDLGLPWRDDLYGQGRLGCGSAVQAATGPPPPTSTPIPTPTPTPTRTPIAPNCPITAQVSADGWWGHMRLAGPTSVGVRTSAAPVSPLITDRPGDHRTSRGSPVVDIVSVEAGATLTEVTIRTNFSSDTIMGCVTGLIDLDTDQNTRTGVTPSANRLLPGIDQVLGVDFSLALRPGGPLADVVNASTGSVVGSVPASAVGQSIEISIPLTLLGSDDGNMDVAMVFGNVLEPTDAAPEEGHATVGLGIREGRVDLSSSLPSQTVSVTASFTTSVLMRVDDKMVIELPSGFDVSRTTLVSKSGFDGQASVTVSGQRVVVARIPSLNTLAGTGAKTIVLGNAVNPSATGLTASFTIRHQSASEVDVEAPALVAGVAIGGPIGAPVPGGGGFGLSSGPEGVVLTWQTGVGQTGYIVFRFSGTERATLPSAGPLPATATSFTDTASPTGFSCYALLPVSGSPPAPVGLSDILCVTRDVRSATGAPQNFTIRLHESNVASFTWTPPPGGGHDGYLLSPSGGSAILLSASATTARHAITGFTCYTLAAVAGSSRVGNTDEICGVPGHAHLAGL